MTPATPRLLLLPIALFIALSLRLILTTPFPAPDELEHLSYAAHLQETHRLIPLFKSQTVLDRTDFTRWDTQPNYIGHPSPYYLLIAHVLDRTLPPDQAILLPRLASFTLLLLAVAIALHAGLRCFPGHTPAFAVFAIALCLCPQLFSAARQVTNDSLAILGGALAYAGLAPNPRRIWRANAAIAAGLTFALWAKPNAGLGVGLLLAATILFDATQRRRILAATIAGGIIGLIPTIPIIVTYHTLVPVTVEALWPIPSIPNPAAYLPIFLFNVGYTWAYLTTPIFPPATLPAFTVTLAFWLTTALLAPTAIRPKTPNAPLAAATIAAATTLLLIHFTFSATSLHGSIPAASFRYYLPLLPALAHTAATTLQSAPTPTRRRLTATALATTMLLGWIV